MSVFYKTILGSFIGGIWGRVTASSHHIPKFIDKIKAIGLNVDPVNKLIDSVNLKRVICDVMLNLQDPLNQIPEHVLDMMLCNPNIFVKVKEINIDPSLGGLIIEIFLKLDTYNNI